MSIFHYLFFEFESSRLERSVSLFVLSGDFTWSFNWKWFICFFILLIFFLSYEFRRNSYLLWSWKAVSIWECPFAASMSLIFLAQGLFLVWLPAVSFLSVCWQLSSWQGVWLMCSGQLSRTSSLLCCCHTLWGGRVFSQVVWVDTPGSHIWTVVWGRQD